MKKNTDLKILDTPYFNYWQTIYLSFYSRQLYVDVGKRWKGFGFKYLLLLLLLLSLPLALSLGSEYQYYIKNYIKPMETVPSFVIQNGKVSFDKPMPYEVKNDLGQTIVIIDTTGQVTKKQLYDNKFPFLNILVVSDRVYTRLPYERMTDEGKSVSADDFSEQIFGADTNVVSQSLTAKQKTTIKRVGWFAVMMIYPGVVAVFFGITSGILVIAALVGQLMASIVLRFTITYQQSLRILCVAATPAIFFAVTNELIALKIPYFQFGVITLLAIYFSYAVLCLKKESGHLTAYL